MELEMILLVLKSKNKIEWQLHSGAKIDWQADKHVKNLREKTSF